MKKNKTFVRFALIALVLCLAVLPACKKSDDPKQTTLPEKTEDKEKMKAAEGYSYSKEATKYVDILMDSGAHIVVELDAGQAPITVKNFQSLVGQSFYDGLIFHRIIEGFMIQGGDPTGTGTGGSPDKIKGEFQANGVNNTLSHTRGVVSMARTNDPDSASSQFFICHEDSSFLDGNYAAFGRVVFGIEEVDRIATLATNAQDYPENPPKMEHVFFVTPAN